MPVRVLGVRRGTNRTRSHDPRPQGGDHRHRRFVRQLINSRRMFEPARLDRGILRHRRDDEEIAGGELAAMAVGASLWGPLQSDWGVRHRSDQDRVNRQPVWLREYQMAAGQSDL